MWMVQPTPLRYRDVALMDSADLSYSQWVLTDSFCNVGSWAE